MLFLLCLSSVSASVVTRYGSDFKVVGGELSYKISDRLGSDRLTLNDDKIIAESNVLPYGQQLKNNNVKFGFTGKELDDTNNYYFNARYYDFDSGKFLGVDPVSDNHAYSFVSNNPMNMVDPSGMADFFVAESTGVNFNSFEMTKNGHGSDEYLSAVLTDYINSRWYDMIRDDIPEINSVSKATGVPAEAMLSAIFVEDIRTFAPEYKDIKSWSYIKSTIRQHMPDRLLIMLGHLPNPKQGDSAYGMIHEEAIGGAVRYLKTIEGLNDGTKSLISRVSSENQDYQIFDSFSGVERAALVLKAHMIFWDKSGYNLFDFDFETIDSFGERVGVLETLNSIYAYNGKDLLDYRSDKLIPKGFAPAIWERMPGYGKMPETYCVPHDCPRLGGTPLWDGKTNYGDISRIFVDSGLAGQIMERGIGSSIATSDIPDQ